MPYMRNKMAAESTDSSLQFPEELFAILLVVASLVNQFMPTHLLLVQTLKVGKDYTIKCSTIQCIVI